MHEEISLMEDESINNFRIPLMILIYCWVHYEAPCFLITKKHGLKKYSASIHILLYVSIYIYIHTLYLYKNKVIGKC